MCKTGIKKEHEVPNTAEVSVLMKCRTCRLSLQALPCEWLTSETRSPAGPDSTLTPSSPESRDHVRTIARLRLSPFVHRQRPSIKHLSLGRGTPNP